MDKTGQRKPADNIANLSSAVTQGAEVWVIKALQEVGNESWFEVVERVGMDNLIKERQLIRNTREVYEKEMPNGPTPLKPMLFAGLILEGGVVGYDANTHCRWCWCKIFRNRYSNRIPCRYSHRSNEACKCQSALVEC